MSVDFWGLPISEDLQKWDTGVWVHYSKHPDVKINPQQFHQDVAGIYLFPESFKPEGSWFKMPYKFKVKANVSNILDLSKLTTEAAVEMLREMVPEKEFIDYAFEVEKAQEPIDTFWEMLKSYFVHVKGRATGEWNKAFRDLGYDAIFDDTGSIMGNEVQLVVLDPTKVKVIERIEQGSTGYKEVKEIAEKLADLLRVYGEVSVVEPKTDKSCGTPQLVSTVSVKSGDKGLVWDISPRFIDKGDAVPDQFSVSLKRGASELRRQMSRGATLRMNERPWDYKDLEREVKAVAAHEFAVKESLSEAKGGRYFHCTTEKIAKEILSKGYSHRYHSPGTGWTDRFQDDDQWFNYYHLFFPAYSEDEQEEMTEVLHDDDIPEVDRGKWMRQKWTKDHGDDWSIVWLGKDRVFPGYGNVVLEFIPGSKDIISDDLEYHYAIHFNKVVPASQFKFIGKFESDWFSDHDQETDTGTSWKEASKHLAVNESDLSDCNYLSNNLSQRSVKNDINEDVWKNRNLVTSKKLITTSGQMSGSKKPSQRKSFNEGTLINLDTRLFLRLVRNSGQQSLFSNQVKVLQVESSVRDAGVSFKFWVDDNGEKTFRILVTCGGLAGVDDSFLSNIDSYDALFISIEKGLNESVGGASPAKLMDLFWPLEEDEDFFAEWADYAEVPGEQGYFKAAFEVATTRLANATQEGKNVKVWRAVTVKDINSIDIKSIGVAWSYKQEAAHNWYGGSGHKFVIVGLAPLSSIDDFITLRQNMVNPGEYEIRLDNHSKVLIVSILDESGKEIKKFNPPLIANSGGSQFGGRIEQGELPEARDDWKTQGYTISSNIPWSEYKDDQIWYVFAKDSSGKTVGRLGIIKNDDELKKGKISSFVTSVDNEHRRKGLATAMYQYAEKHSGLKMAPNSETSPDPKDFSKDAAALWSQPNRPFGEDVEYFGEAGAGGLFYAEDTGRYLFAHRSEDVNEPGTWGTWGGKLEHGESPEEALRREIKEESGYIGKMHIQHVYTYRDGDFTFDNYIITVPREFEPKHSWETQGHVWATLDELPSPLHYGLKEMLKHMHVSESVDQWGIPVVN